MNTERERDARVVAADVTWTDLLDPSDGCEILDTAARVITLEQLRQTVTHSERRLKVDEKGD